MMMTTMTIINYVNAASRAMALRYEKKIGVIITITFRHEYRFNPEFEGKPSTAATALIQHYSYIRRIKCRVHPFSVQHLFY